MELVVRDGLVAVLYSPGYGAGWFSWHHEPKLLFDPSIVAWLEADELDKILAYVTLTYPDLYLGGLDGLTIAWLPRGSRFRIDSYDGAEHIVLETEDTWITV